MGLFKRRPKAAEEPSNPLAVTNFNLHDSTVSCLKKRGIDADVPDNKEEGDPAAASVMSSPGPRAPGPAPGPAPCSRAEISPGKRNDGVGPLKDRVAAAAMQIAKSIELAAHAHEIREEGGDGGG